MDNSALGRGLGSYRLVRLHHISGAHDETLGKVRLSRPVAVRVSRIRRSTTAGRRARERSRAWVVIEASQIGVSEIFSRSQCIPYMLYSG